MRPTRFLDFFFSKKLMPSYITMMFRKHIFMHCIIYNIIEIFRWVAAMSQVTNRPANMD